MDTLDKYEYKLRSEEIKSLIKKRNFTKAVEIADTIDWSRVRSVSTLCTISDLYKINRRYNESKILLEQAYERYPGGRMIVYSLCELCIKMDEVVQAIEYYKDFVQMAPTDNGKFILQYKIYEAQDVSLEERIAVLEELKKRDYREKWGYELAYLYHRIGLATKCVEECDELILWFREGKYVKKAMELKMLHQQLTSEQEYLYHDMLPSKEQKQYDESTRVITNEIPEENAINQDREPEIHVKTMDVGKYNTINLQKELAESMKEVLVADNGFKPLVDNENDDEVQPGAFTQAIMATMMQDTGEMEELFFDEENKSEPGYQAVEEPYEEVKKTETQRETSHVFETKTQLSDIAGIDSKKLVETAKDPIVELINKKVAEAVETAIKEERPTIREVLNTKFDDADLTKVEPPTSMGRMLSQEYDGQISLVVPEKDLVEKQITGQLNLEEILAEWEKTKKENEEKRKEEVKQRVLEQTGSLFTEFEARVRDGILEKLEKENIANVIKTNNEEEYNKYIKDILGSETDTKDSSDGSKDVETNEELNSDNQKPVLESEVEELPEVEELEEIQENNEEEIPEEKDTKEKDTKDQANDSTNVSVNNNDSEAQENEENIPTRSLSEEEASLFAPFVQTKKARQRLIHALDRISLASYVGNVFVTGETQDETMELAKNVLRDVQITDGNFSGKIAKVTGSSLNGKNVVSTVGKLVNGGLIIEKASGMSELTMNELLKALNQENAGIVVVLQDNKKTMNKMFDYYKGMGQIFNVHIEVEELNDDALVAYGKKYAEHLEYSIDELGILALHTRIDELQTSDHIVTVSDVRDIVDEAIEHTNKKNLKHFADILFAKRYDDDDMIILRERDFLE